jgi:hypothetical protein
MHPVLNIGSNRTFVDQTLDSIQVQWGRLNRTAVQVHVHILLNLYSWFRTRSNTFEPASVCMPIFTILELIITYCSQARLTYLGDV